jgi:hypothetical protein
MLVIVAPSGNYSKQIACNMRELCQMAGTTCSSCLLLLVPKILKSYTFSVTIYCMAREYLVRVNPSPHFSPLCRNSATNCLHWRVPFHDGPNRFHWDVSQGLLYR